MKSFRLLFADADPLSNYVLNEYEEILFLNDTPEKKVTLPKTEKEGDLYEGTQIHNRTVWLPKPFVFSVKQDANHPNASHALSTARAVCLYDNAGEHFLPGGESTGSKATSHLAISQALFFVFDPTQHPVIRKRCEGMTDDPQMHDHGWTHRQDQILNEVGNRIRRSTGLSQNKRDPRPLIVVVTKYDAWMGLIGGKTLKSSHILKEHREGLHSLNLEKLKAISDQIRKLFLKYTPEIVSSADSISSNVIYIPVSALGHSPEIGEKSGFLGVRPKNIHPMWVEIPMIYALSQTASHLIPLSKAKLPTEE